MGLLLDCLVYRGYPMLLRHFAADDSFQRYVLKEASEGHGLVFAFQRQKAFPHGFILPFVRLRKNRH